MSCQFQCPQGHLLEGDESQAGQQCMCPVCQMLFLIPQPLPEPEPASDPRIVVDTGAGSESEPRPAFDPQKAREPDVMHIPCPKGHELEVPRDMLGQDVMCPHCESQFRLREKDSIEFKKRVEEEQHRREMRASSAWLQWTIILAVIGVLGLIMLFAMRAGA